MLSLQYESDTIDANNVDGTSARNRKRFLPADYALMSVLMACIAITYWPAATFDFVNWDDPWYITNNPLIRSWHPANLARIATEPVTRNYAPLTILSFLIDHTFWGDQPTGYHLTNILLHAANAILVYVLIMQLTGNRVIAWTTAAFFALHPVQVETVAWVSSRKGLLSATFMLASLIQWLRLDRKPKNEALGIVFLTTALFSKAIAVVVPPIVLCYDVLVRRQRCSEAIVRQFLPGLLAVWVLLLTMSAQTTELGGVRHHLHFGKLQILMIDLVIMWRYVSMLLCPAHLSVLYDPATTNFGFAAAIAAVGWGLVATIVYRLRTKNRLIPFAAVTFLLLLVPVLNLFPITTLMNDRYLYLPTIPFFAVAISGCWRSAGWIAKRFGERRMQQSLRLALSVTVTTILAAAVVSTAVRTQHRLPVWKSGLALWQDTIQKTPQLSVVRIQLSDALRDAGRREEAIEVLESALIETTPDLADRNRIDRKLAELRQQPDPSFDGT